MPRLESAQAPRDGQEGTGAHACRTLGMMLLLKKGCVRLEVENVQSGARAGGPLRSERSCGEGCEAGHRRYGTPHHPGGGGSRRRRRISSTLTREELM